MRTLGIPRDSKKGTIGILVVPTGRDSNNKKMGTLGDPRDAKTGLIGALYSIGIPKED